MDNCVNSDHTTFSYNRHAVSESFEEEKNNIEHYYYTINEYTSRRLIRI